MRGRGDRRCAKTTNPNLHGHHGAGQNHVFDPDAGCRIFKNRWLLMLLLVNYITIATNQICLQSKVPRTDLASGKDRRSAGVGRSGGLEICKECRLGKKAQGHRSGIDVYLRITVRKFHRAASFKQSQGEA